MAGTRRRAWIPLLTVLAVLVPTSAVMASMPEACVDVTVVGLGDACRRPNGLLQIDADSGTGLLVHGPDFAAIGSEVPVAAASPRPPVCAPAGTRRMIVVYARPADATNKYSDRVGMIRGLVADSNAQLNLEAQARGATADYRVACDEDLKVTVRNEVLPTLAGVDSFGSVVSDLRSKGYTSTTEKVWVWYEGSVGSGIAGTGHLYWDESRSVDNRNNGGPGTSSTFAVLWGAVAGYSVRTWMHENGHNLGAVQKGAPDSTGAAHCTDGQDVMCYADGGAPYDPNVCTDRVYFDCGHDSYFNPDPAAGSYLATHWNLAWSRNLFLDMKPTMALPQSSASVNEQAGEVNVVVHRRGVIDTQVPFTWNIEPADTSDVGTTAGSDYFDSGQRSLTLTIPIIQDDIEEDTEVFSITFASSQVGSAPVSMTLSIADGSNDPEVPSTGPLPDLAIGTSLSGPFRQPGLRNTTGEGQTRGLVVTKGRTASFVIRGINAGDTAATFRLRVESVANYKVVVRDARSGKWLGSTWSVKKLNLTVSPNQIKVLRLQVMVPKNALSGKRLAVKTKLWPIGQQDLDVALANVRVR